MAAKKKVRKIQGPPMKITVPVLRTTGYAMGVRPRAKVAAKLKARAKAKKV